MTLREKCSCLVAGSGFSLHAFKAPAWTSQSRPMPTAHRYDLA
jgi:hypothetical protein